MVRICFTNPPSVHHSNEQSAELQRRLNERHIELETPEILLCSGPDEHSATVGVDGNMSPEIMQKSSSPMLRQSPVIDQAEQKLTLLSDLAKSDLYVAN